MESKFLYFLHRETFDRYVDSFPRNLNPLCFIEDSNEIWFNNHFFQAGHDSLRVQEINNVVSVLLSESNFNIVPGSESITVRAQGNSIIVSSTALTKIDTDDFLEWKDGKLYHKKVNVTPGSYGPRLNETGVYNINTYQITVDEAGHITKIEQRTQTIRDYVEQRQSDTENKDRQILIASKDSEYDDTNVTMKGRNATYNNLTGELKVPKIKVSGQADSNAVVIQNGNVVVSNGYIEGRVKGEVEGTATPKIHLSLVPDYGGASLNTYGHVMLIDEIPDTPERSSDNNDLNNKNIEAKAASPYAVYDYFQRNKMEVKVLNNTASNLITLGRSWEFSDDFKANVDNKIEIKWTEY